jgi:Fe-S-cluster containining protein
VPIHLPVLQALASPKTMYRSKDEASTDCSYCRSPCCQLLVELRPDEVERFAHEDFPFPDGTKKILKRRPEDGYCVYYVHGQGCSTYDDKPYVCDFYSCRTDGRITPSLKYGKVRKTLR